MSSCCIDVFKEDDRDEVEKFIDKKNNGLKEDKKYGFQYADFKKENANAESLFPLDTEYRVYEKPLVEGKFHPLQRFYSARRRFDVSDELADIMRLQGPSTFYEKVCGYFAPDNSTNSDLTTIRSLNTITKSADRVFIDISNIKGDSTAGIAKQAYMRGFSRPITVESREDWEQFRKELRESTSTGTILCSNGQLRLSDDEVLPIAVSYKGTTAKISRRFSHEDPENDETRSDEIVKESVTLSKDFVDDFRWDQIRRTCIQIAGQENYSHISTWIDRLAMWGVGKEQRKRIYSEVSWEDFGLMPYAVCPVVRVYDNTESEFGTDFWRKLETVLGIAGRGLYVDDYLLRYYDDSIYYDLNIYHSIAKGNGICRLGGTGKYLRSISLALATSIFTESISVYGRNEDDRTVQAFIKWKSWALRTISEGAYKADLPLLMTEQPKIDIDLEKFKLIAFWESYVSNSKFLEGENYADITTYRSKEHRSSSKWDGISEWIGMVRGSYDIDKSEKDKIYQFLNSNVQIEVWSSSSRHVAALLYLTYDESENIKKCKRTITVALTRFSTEKEGQVIHVAESTGIWEKEKNVLPGGYFFRPNPEQDQKVSIMEVARRK